MPVHKNCIFGFLGAAKVKKELACFIAGRHFDVKPEDQQEGRSRRPPHLHDSQARRASACYSGLQGLFLVTQDYKAFSGDFHGRSMTIISHTYTSFAI
jgi:hypothetical protein